MDTTTSSQLCPSHNIPRIYLLLQSEIWLYNRNEFTGAYQECFVVVACNVIPEPDALSSMVHIATYYCSAEAVWMYGTSSCSTTWISHDHVLLILYTILLTYHFECKYYYCNTNNHALKWWNLYGIGQQQNISIRVPLIGPFVAHSLPLKIIVLSRHVQTTSMYKIIQHEFRSFVMCVGETHV